MAEWIYDLVACSLTMGAVTLGALALTPLLERRYARKALYAMWLVVLFMFLCPVRPEIFAQHAVTVRVPQRMTEPLEFERIRLTQTAQTTQTAAAVTTAVTELEQETGFQLPEVTLVQVLAAMYLTGALVTLVMQLMRHMRFMKTVRRWQRPVADKTLLALYDEAAREIGVRRKPALMRCEAISSPMLVGLVRPRILLPAAFEAGQAAGLVLRHELMHAKEHDLLVRALMMIARAMHWFNPMVYLCLRMVDVSCEMACDERAMRGVDRQQRALYGNAIIACLRGANRTMSPLTTGLSMDKQMLKRRLVSMMDMKLRKRGALIALLAAVMSVAVGASFVLADGSVQPYSTVEHTYTMTKEEMIAIYEASNEKLNSKNNWSDGIASIQAYEAEVLAEGGELKEDMIISTLPGEDDMTYEDALAYAYELIIDKFGTPREEIEAMGVYPNFWEYPYMDEEPEWEFYFTPRTDTDIQLDHLYPEQGEYRVSFKSQSREVLLCIWYIDDFWPYAQRTWDAGKTDYVYEEAKSPSFLMQPVEVQQHFTKLLTDAGYDLSFTTSDGIIALMNWTEDNGQRIEAYEGDAAVAAALDAIETLGYDADRLIQYGYVVGKSPLSNEKTVTICLTHVDYDADVIDNPIIAHLYALTSKFGGFVVEMDAQTGEILALASRPNRPSREEDTSDPFMSRYNWTAEDMAAFNALIDAAIAADENHPDDLRGMMAEFYPLLAEAGAIEADYVIPEITEEEAIETAVQAIMQERGLTREQFDLYYPIEDRHVSVVGDNWFLAEQYVVGLPLGEAATGGRYGYWADTVYVDAMTGEVKEINLSSLEWGA